MILWILGLVRLVSLAPNLTEMVLWLESPEVLVGVTVHDTFQAVKHLPRVGGFADPSWERILALHPDRVLMTHTQAPLFQEDARHLGLVPLVLSTRTVDELFHALDTLAGLLGRDTIADRIRKRLNARMPTSSPAGHPPRVMVVVSRMPGSLEGLYVAGRGTFYHDLIQRVGWVNTVTQTGYLPLSPERALRLHPAWILDITGDPQPRVYEILKPQRVLFLPADPFQRPGLCALWVFLQGWESATWKSTPCPPSEAIAP